MNQNVERRAARPRARGHNRIVRSSAQIVAAAGAMVAAVAWAANRPIEAGKPGNLLELPAAVISAPAGTGSSTSSQFSFLSNAVARAEVEAPSPVTRRIAAVLRRYAKDDRVADRAAAAVVREGRKNNVDPVLIVGLMIIENAKIDPSARSNVNATGLMQVMPFHRGKWDCGSNNLVDVETNICYGTKILKDAITRAPNLNKALLRYNGCVRGTNTPNCHTYPRKVLGYANHVSTMMNAVARGNDITKISLFPPGTFAKAKANRPARSKAKSRARTSRTRLAANTRTSRTRVATARRSTRTRSD